jgi:hypothetical protein
LAALIGDGVHGVQPPLTVNGSGVTGVERQNLPDPGGWQLRQNEPTGSS